MKKKKYLPLYETWVTSGFMPEHGLCNFFGSPEGPDTPNVKYEYQDFLLMMPNKKDQTRNNGYWGTELRNCEERQFSFCPLRQNIVLFLAAMNDEL